MLNTHAKAKCGHAEPISARTLGELQEKTENAKDRLCTRCQELKKRDK